MLQQLKKMLSKLLGKADAAGTDYRQLYKQGEKQGRKIYFLYTDAVIFPSEDRKTFLMVEKVNEQGKDHFYGNNITVEKLQSLIRSEIKSNTSLFHGLLHTPFETFEDLSEDMYTMRVRDIFNHRSNFENMIRLFQSASGLEVFDSVQRELHREQVSNHEYFNDISAGDLAVSAYSAKQKMAEVNVLPAGGDYLGTEADLKSKNQSRKIAYEAICALLSTAPGRN